MSCGNMVQVMKYLAVESKTTDGAWNAMYHISSKLRISFVKEICLPAMRSTAKVEKDDNGNLQCTNKSIYEIQGIKTVSYGLESIRYLVPKIWKLIPDELIELKSLDFFKKK